MLEDENTVLASFFVSEKIVKHPKSFSDAEFVKECFATVVDILCPNNSNNMHTINLSCCSVTRHINELAANLEQSLRDRASKFEAYSLAINKSMNVSDTSQLPVLECRVDAEFNITEEMLSIQPRMVFLLKRISFKK
jgi:hypothetical protein